MALRLEQKQAIVDELGAAANDAISAVLADYRGMTVAELTELRRQARDAGVTLRVVRNSLLRRAVAGTQFECLSEAAAGPTVLALSREDLGAAARLVKEAAERFDALDVKAVSVGGRLYWANDIDRVASLPTREEALARLMATMLAPAARLAAAFAAVPAKLARTLDAVRERKENTA